MFEKRFLTCALLLLAVPAVARPQQFRIERDVPVPMRDGTILRADVWRPDGSGPFPVLVSRTPYGKHGHKFEPHVRAGYIVVCQDVRGRYKSDGEFESFIRFETHDAEDGYDTVEWAAKLPDSTGKVGTLGGSYNGFLQWRLAALRPPSLVAMAACSIPARYTDLEGPGAIRPGRRLAWWYYTISPDLRKRSNGLPPHSNSEAKKLWENGDSPRLLNLLPRSELPDALFGTEAEPVKCWLRNAHLDPWQLDESCRDVAVPNLDIVGWFDHCNGSIDLHQAMKEHGKTEVARKHQHLVIGPWSHSGRGARKVGDFDFGALARFNIAQAEIRWFDYWLKGKPNGVDQEAPVRIFLMGANHWREESQWPPQPLRKLEFYLGSDGNANTPAGDGRLLSSATRELATDRYNYDPSDPVPTLWTKAMFTVPMDQRPLSTRRDILVYQSETLHEPITVVGYPEMSLCAMSTAPDTDFFARLVDVAPDGTARDVASGMVRARYRTSLREPKLLDPDEVTQFIIKLRATANVFLPGHRIRLDITSSDFPNYERNHNTAADQNADSTFEVATQTIFHGGEYPSKLILPLIETGEKSRSPIPSSPSSRAYNSYSE